MVCLYGLHLHLQPQKAIESQAKTTKTLGFGGVGLGENVKKCRKDAFYGYLLPKK